MSVILGTSSCSRLCPNLPCILKNGPGQEHQSMMVPLRYIMSLLELWKITSSTLAQMKIMGENWNSSHSQVEQPKVWGIGFSKCKLILCVSAPVPYSDHCIHLYCLSVLEKPQSETHRAMNLLVILNIWHVLCLFVLSPQPNWEPQHAGTRAESLHSDEHSQSPDTVSSRVLKEFRV